MDTIILKFVLAVAGLFLKKDVDLEKLKVIVQTKLMMDRRRVRVTMKKQTDKEPKNQMLITQLVYAFFGLMMAGLVAYLDAIVLSMIFLHSYILFMMAMTMITDFSTVMLDTADNQIVLPRPVSSQTLFTARLVHILVYLLQFTIALALFPAITIFIVFGPLVGIAAIFTIAFTVAFAVFLTYLLYALILRFANEEKVKDIVSYFQIFMTVFFASGYQILPRLINFDQLKQSFALHTYSYFLPPVWMAVALEAVHNFNFDAIHILMMVLALFVPALTFWIMIKFLAPAFAKKLSAMGSGTDAAAGKVVAEKQTYKKPFEEKLSQLLGSNNTEKAGFELTWKMTARDRPFKMQFYPGLAYIFVFAFVIVFKSGANIGRLWATLGSTDYFLWLVYLPIFSVSPAVTLVAFNENFTAAWVYLSSPLYKPGSLISGSLKALLARFFVPIFILMFGFSFYIWGIRITDDFLLGFFSNILIFLLLAHLNNSHLPFSMQPGVKQQMGKFIKIFVQLLMIAVLVVLHYFSLMLPWLTAALIPFVAAGCYFMFKTIQQYKWSQIIT